MMPGFWPGILMSIVPTRITAAVSVDASSRSSGSPTSFDRALVHLDDHRLGQTASTLTGTVYSTSMFKRVPLSSGW
jgi:hypothetical protein